MPANAYLSRALGIFAGPALGVPNTFALDASTDALERCFYAEEALTITHLFSCWSAVLGTSPVYEISLQGVTAAGIPDGTIKAGTNAKATFTPTSGNNDVGNWHALTSSYACARGEPLAIVIKYSSGTINGSNFATFHNSLGSYGPSLLPAYSLANDAGVRTRSSYPRFGYSDGTNKFGAPVRTLTTQTFNDGTNPDEYALRFVVPTDWGWSSYTIAGMKAAITLAVTGATTTFTLYDGTTALQQIAIDNDIAQVIASMQAGAPLFDEVTLSSLTPGNVYRLGIKNNDGATNMSLQIVNFQANSDMNRQPGGVECYLSTRNNGGAWTDDTAKRPMIEPVFSEFTAVAGGGVLRNAGLNGGLL
jgi:hypothetical protein